MPDFTGLLAFPGGNRVGFTEMLKESLAEQGIKVTSRAKYVFSAHLQRTDESGTRGFRVALSGKVMDDRGRVVQEIEGGWIDDGKELAETVGVTTHFGPASTGKIRQTSFRRSYDDRVTWVDQNRTIHLGGEDSPYGIEVRVNGQPLRFKEEVEGLAYVDLKRGDEYEVVLHNMSDHEVAVDLKIDGLNRFHFAEPAYREGGRRDGKPNLRYRIIPPRSSETIVGWFKSHSRKTRFKITSIEESAAKKAGIPLDDVGMVSATFYACWEKDSGSRPRDEPKVKETRLITRYVREKRQRPDGSTYEIYKPVHSVRNATGFGTDVTKVTRGVERTIGVPRATVVFRYDR